MKVNSNYQSQSFGSIKLTNNAKKAIESLNPNSVEDMKKFSDIANDIKHKFSMYNMYTYKSKVYMLEAAIAVSTTFLTYNEIPLAYIKKYNLVNEWRQILYLNNRYQYDSRDANKQTFGFLDLNNIDLSEPYLNLTGYATWFKEINNVQQKLYIGNYDLFKQDSTVDLYTDNLCSKSLILCYPYSNEIRELTYDEYTNLVNFERNRPKSKGEKIATKSKSKRKLGLGKRF